MKEVIHGVTGVAPMLATGPCFATPIFRNERSNLLWYQHITGSERISRFAEVSESAALRITHLTDVNQTREIGQPPYYGYISRNGQIHVEEKINLFDMLKEEFEKNLARLIQAHGRDSEMGVYKSLI